MADERILIVEDDAIIAAHLKRLLTNLGYNVFGMVASGEEAIQKVNETPPDLILMDMHLAGNINGIETATQIGNRFDIPVIYLTAHSEDQLVQQAKSSEPHGYLVKPVQDRELYATIEIAFYKYQAEEEIREIKESYDRLTDNADEAIFKIKVEEEGGKVVYMNSTAERIFGYTQADWDSDPTLGSKIIHPDYAEKYGQLYNEMKTEKAIKKIILGWITKDGREVIMESIIIPLMDEKGEITHFESIGRDITE